MKVLAHRVAHGEGGGIEVCSELQGQSVSLAKMLAHRVACTLELCLPLSESFVFLAGGGRGASIPTIA